MMIIRLIPVMGQWRACIILGLKMAHPMAQQWTRKKSRHDKLSAKDASVSEVEDSQDSSNHTPAQKTKRLRVNSPPAKSPSPVADQLDLSPGEFDYLSDSAPRRKTGFRRPRITWAPVASWNLEHNTEQNVFQETARISATSLEDGHAQAQ